MEFRPFFFFCKACAGKEQLYSCNILSSALGEAIVHCPLELLLQCELPPLYLVQVNFAYIGTFIKCFIVQITSKATKAAVSYLNIHYFSYYHKIEFYIDNYFWVFLKCGYIIRSRPTTNNCTCMHSATTQTQTMVMNPPLKSSPSFVLRMSTPLQCQTT